MGDNVVEEALEDPLKTRSSANPSDLPVLFQHLDQAIRRQPFVHAETFSHLGRWRFLQPMERRVMLLTELEQFSCGSIADITGLSVAEVRGLLGRARMKYADRFPARMAVYGGGAKARWAAAAALHACGHHLIWESSGTVPPAEQPSRMPSAILLICDEDTHPEGWAAALHDLVPGGAADRSGSTGTFDGPVIVANDVTRIERLDERAWAMPRAKLQDSDYVREALVRALLFSS
ncbi:hypothetical protein [uncultured Hyphomonas sp.]|uniref:hypothetical protein n=1 Tax=uncultured Hyphomonas sp. TaxID=225298 RepID=UPI00374A36C6